MPATDSNLVPAFMFYKPSSLELSILLLMLLKTKDKKSELTVHGLTSSKCS